MTRLATCSFRAFLLCLAIFLLSSPLSAEIGEVSVRIEPLQPLLGQDFTVIVEGAGENVLLEDVLVGPEEFRDGTEIRVLLREGCVAACMPGSFEFSVPIDASAAEFPEDDHAISIRTIDASNEESVELYKRFAVGATYGPHPLGFRTYVNPRSPTDNDLVRLITRTEGNVCGPSAAEFVSSEVVGNVVNVFLQYYPGFGGGFATSAGPDKCTPPAPYDVADLGALGVLDEGNYRLDIYIEEVGDFGTLPIRTRRSELTVTDGPDLAALQNGRFEVRIDWRDFEGQTGVGRPVPGATKDSTLFSFFGDDNWEVLVKILDACTLNGKFWVLTAAATTVEYTTTIFDLETGAVWSYDNPLGFPSPAVTDIEAFDCSP